MKIRALTFLVFFALALPASAAPNAEQRIALERISSSIENILNADLNISN